MVTQAPFVQTPLQQSAALAQVVPSALHGSEQLPPRQSPLQQSAFVVHTPAVGVQLETGAHDGGVPVHDRPQHSALKLQLPPVAMHGIWHVSIPMLFGRHCPLQQSAFLTHPAPVARHVPAP